MGTSAQPAPTRGVPITLDRVRYLRFSLATRRKIREEFGEDTKAYSGDSLAKLLWYGLLGDDPQLTLEQVEELIDMEHLPEVMDAVQKAMGSKAKATIVTDPPAPSPAAASGQDSTKSGE